MLARERTKSLENNDASQQIESESESNRESESESNRESESESNSENEIEKKLGGKKQIIERKKERRERRERRERQRQRQSQRQQTLQEGLKFLFKKECKAKWNEEKKQWNISFSKEEDAEVVHSGLKAYLSLHLQQAAQVAQVVSSEEKQEEAKQDEVKQENVFILNLTIKNAKSVIQKAKGDFKKAYDELHILLGQNPDDEIRYNVQVLIQNTFGDNIHKVFDNKNPGDLKDVKISKVKEFLEKVDGLPFPQSQELKNSLCVFAISAVLYGLFSASIFLIPLIPTGAAIIYHTPRFFKYHSKKAVMKRKMEAIFEGNQPQMQSAASI